jgi:hypothetical protein
MKPRSVGAVCALVGAVGAALVAAPFQREASAQKSTGVSAPPKVLIDPADTVVLLLDHPNGLFQTVKDVPLANYQAVAESYKSAQDGVKKSFN